MAFGYQIFFNENKQYTANINEIKCGNKRLYRVHTEIKIYIHGNCAKENWTLKVCVKIKQKLSLSNKKEAN